MKSPTLTLLTCLLVSFGCNDDFSSVAEGTRPFAVFGVLLNTTDTQFVRVHKTSDPTETLTGNPGIPGTTVTVTGNGATIIFRDTLLTPNAGSSDSTPIPAYFGAPFRPVRGATYDLVVQTPTDVATSTVTIPGGDWSMRSSEYYILDNPFSFSASSPIILIATLSPQTLGYSVRMVVEYELLISSTWTLQNLEVPLSYLDPGSPDPKRAIFPTLIRRRSSNQPSGGRQTADVASFNNGAYRLTLQRLYETYDPASLRMKRVIFILYQADRNFFTYFSLANFFQDKYSIRVDQPDYSNINGALGFFGAMTADSIWHEIPPDLEP